MAKGKYIAFIDADDVVDENYMELMLNAMESYDVDLVVTAYDRFYENDLERKIHYQMTAYSGILAEDNVTFAQVFGTPSTNLFGISVWGKLYKKDIIQKHNITFPLNISYEEDCIFNLEYYRHMQKTLMISNTVYHYRQQLASLSKTYKKTTFKDLINGFQNRRKFAEDLEMTEDFFDSLNKVFFVTILNNYKKIAMSDMSKQEKEDAYAEILSYPEVNEIFQEINSSKVRLTRWLTHASKKKNAKQIAAILRLWKLKDGLRRKQKGN